jgi:hypothetical protein
MEAAEPTVENLDVDLRVCAEKTERVSVSGSVSGEATDTCSQFLSMGPDLPLTRRKREVTTETDDRFERVERATEGENSGAARFVWDELVRNDECPSDWGAAEIQQEPPPPPCVLSH